MNDPEAYQKEFNRRVQKGVAASYRNGRKPVGTKQYKKFSYKGIYMKSSYEVIFAQWLTQYKIKWKYEPKRFDLPKSTYTPDFYIPKVNIWVETKGYHSKLFWNKLIAFHKTYPSERIIIVDVTKIDSMRADLIK